MTHTSLSIEALGQRIFDTLARAFPVACATDEFFYFPHVRIPEQEWGIWDCFSKERVTEFVKRLSNWEEELRLLGSYESDTDRYIDIALLQSFIRTLREQLSEIRVWESQPTFYLTLACVGLAWAMESGDPSAIHEQAKGLADFLDQAVNCLDRIPVLFRDLGLEMIPDVRDYLLFLGSSLPELRSATLALDRFEDKLKHISTREDFLLPNDLLEHILRFHLRCDMGINEINNMIDLEIDEMRRILNKEARGFVCQDNYPNGVWVEALKHIPLPVIGEEGLIGLYANEVNSLAGHCMGKGLVSPSLVSSCPVRVAPVPSFLSVIRTASSYSIQPEHPPSGGVFYILDKHISDGAGQENLREYRMLSAHETYPGHHLLDTSRLSLTRACRRVLELPLFYEGWACFAEELLRFTGYFSDPGDHLLLTKRRLWRALRGKADIGLQTGAMDIPSAARYLTETGISVEQAMSLVRKYPLNPGYRLCYTLGERRLLDLFDHYGRDNLQNFVHIVLGQGEIHFEYLEKILETQ